MNRLLPPLCVMAIAAAACCAAQSIQKEKVTPIIPIKAEPFSLYDVRLLDGPFKHAMDLDHKYLLSLDADRLLRNFRVNAGIATSAQPYGGWEAPDCELRGHFVGHYLSACSMMYASTGDPALKARAEYIVSALAECQKKLGTGYLSAFPESFIDRVIALKPVWAPWYTLHKILAGLLDVYSYLGDRQALEVAEKMANWAKGRMDKLTDDQMQKMLLNEQGGMNEALANLYAFTGNKDYLELSERFDHRAVLDPLSQEEDRLTGLHANTQIPKVIGAARQYELTGDAKMKEAAGFFWDVVTKDRSYVIGGNSDGEHFSPKERLSAFLSPTTAETCNTYNMLKLTRHLFEWDPKVEYADYYERALYNHILASQNPETGMMCYYVPLSSGSSKRYSSPDDSFWCCTGTGVENHSKYGDSIYFHHGANSLYVNLFIASTLSWKQRGVVITQHTGFPDETATHLSFECRAPERFTLLIRHPSWAGPGFKIEVNECAGQESSRPGSYAEISRTWRSGDRVDISLPMQLHTEGFKDNPNRLAFLDGPIVLCAAVSSRRSVPVIVSPENELLSGVKPEAGQPLSFNADSSEFHLEGAARNGNLKMTPFYAMTGHDYAVYYDVLTPAQWRKREEDNRAELARQAEMAAREVDVVTPGDEASETAHKLAGERTESGDLDDRQWRDARYGGWFSYELKVLPGADQELDCAYWGSDRGRVFDILVDGQQIATQRLDENHPGIFFDAVYPLPAALLQGKQTVTVRFQARPRGMAGGLFGCRILKKVAAARVP